MTLAKPLHRGVRSSAAESSALGPPSPLLSPAQPSSPCPCPVYPAIPAVPSGWNEPSGPRPRDPFEPAPAVHPPRVPAQIKIDSALATRRVFMVPTNSAHKTVSTCRDAGTTSSPEYLHRPPSCTLDQPGATQAIQSARQNFDVSPNTRWIGYHDVSRLVAFAGLTSPCYRYGIMDTAARDVPARANGQRGCGRRNWPISG